MGEPVLKERVTDLERAMMEMVYQSMRRDMAIQDLLKDSKTFRWEMKAFKDEMTDFKDEMKQSRIDREKSDEDFKVRMEKSDATFREEMNQFKTNSEKSDEEFKSRMEKSDAKFREEMNQFKIESRQDRKKMNKQWGELANKMGTIVEDIVAPGLGGIARRYFQVDDFDFFAVRLRTLNSEGTSKREFDVVAETRDRIFIVETKATARTEYISDFIKLIPDLKSWFPVIGKKKLIPIFASLHIPESGVSQLTANNIFAMGMGDDGMELYNPRVLEQITG